MSFTEQEGIELFNKSNHLKNLIKTAISFPKDTKSSDVYIECKRFLSSDLYSKYLVMANHIKNKKKLAYSGSSYTYSERPTIIRQFERSAEKLYLDRFKGEAPNIPYSLDRLRKKLRKSHINTTDLDDIASSYDY